MVEIEPPKVPKTVFVDNENTYKITVTCSNCSYDGNINLEKGKLVVEILPETKCPTCGCTTLTLTKRTEPKKQDFLRNPIVSPNYKPVPFFGDQVNKRKFGFPYDKFTFRTSMTKTINDKCRPQYSITPYTSDVKSNTMIDRHVFGPIGGTKLARQMGVMAMPRF